MITDRIGLHSVLLPLLIIIDRTQHALRSVKNPYLSECKTKKKRVLLFFATLPLYHEANEEAQAVKYTAIKHSGDLRTLEKCRKHSPAARVFNISFVFSNSRRVFSQRNTSLRLLFFVIWTPKEMKEKQSGTCSFFFFGRNNAPLRCFDKNQQTHFPKKSAKTSFDSTKSQKNLNLFSAKQFPLP